MMDPRLDQTFDVIIAGAGPAGCVLASRLSEEPDKRVLLIEAGPDAAAPDAEHPDVLDPFCLMASYNQAFHWPGLFAQTDLDPSGTNPRAPLPYIQGHGVGGASNINGMGADRGQPDDYDAWRNSGADGWEWDSVLPYFKKLEHDLDFETATDAHGACGPMPVRRLPRAKWEPFAAAIGQALERRGYTYLEDYMNDFRDGFSAAPMNCTTQRRVSASSAYLTREVRRRPNLAILSDTNVERLRFDGRRTCGVLTRHNGVTGFLRGGQVIVACGAIQSPALLLRSGIGPSAELAKHGIALVQDLACVGANLRNHPCVALTTYLPPESAQSAGSPSFLQNWLRFSSNHPGCEPSDMHLMVFNKGDWHALGRRVGTLVVSVLNSYSTGRVELASSDPAIAPTVRFNSRADRRDYERLIDGTRLALELLLDPIVASKRHEIFLPRGSLVAGLHRRNAWNRASARAVTLLLDRARLRRFLLADSRIDPERLLADETALQEFVGLRAGVQFHVCGTCRMGRADDPGAVVSSDGRVHGVEALRIADASIFPTVPRGYTHFIVLMAAEKLADAVKNDWRVERSQQAREMRPRVASSLERVGG